MTRTRRIVLSTSFGAAALAAALAPMPFADLFLLPGRVLASPLWPQGIHTGSGLSNASFYAYLTTIYLGVIGAWGGLAYAILGRRAKAAKGT